MTRKTITILICSALALGCGRTQTAKRNEQNYQVVQEGQASGVTSTINAPGETTPPLTDTAVDTTTNFTLPDNPAPLGSQQPGTVAGTLPSTTVPNVPPRVPVSTQPPPMSSNAGPVTTATVPPPHRQPAPPQQQQEPQQHPVPTQTTATQAPPQTDTAAPPPPKTDTTQTQPKTDTTKTDTTKTDTAPPPPPTDTTKTDTQPKTDTTSTEKPPV